jgi:hypothetical protein
MKTGCWMAALIVICMGVAVAAAPAAQTAADLSVPMRDFERNATLGAALTMRAGLPAEFEEVQQLAERGLAAARQAVARQPGSPEAQYLLGSWLLYGYQVIEVRRITSDPVGGERTEIEPRAVLGLSDTPDEGLAALLRAAELAPKDGQYVLDYATALMDCDRVSQALPVLKKAWAGEPELKPAERMLAGLLLSDAYAYEGQLEQAREWVYAALSLDPAAAKAIERLRHLDAAQAAVVEAALDEAAEAARAEAFAEVYGVEEEEAYVEEGEAEQQEEDWSEGEAEQQEEGWSEGESGQQEEGWSEGEGEYEQAEPYTGGYEPDQAEPYTGGYEPDQPQPYTGEE